MIFSTPHRIRVVVTRRGFSKATVYLESGGFLVTFSKKDVVQVFESVMKVKKPE